MAVRKKKLRSLSGRVIKIRDQQHFNRLRSDARLCIVAYVAVRCSFSPPLLNLLCRQTPAAAGTLVTSLHWSLLATRAAGPQALRENTPALRKALKDYSAKREFSHVLFAEVDIEGSAAEVSSIPLGVCQQHLDYVTKRSTLHTTAGNCTGAKYRGTFAASLAKRSAIRGTYL